MCWVTYCTRKAEFAWCYNNLCDTLQKANMVFNKDKNKSHPLLVTFDVSLKLVKILGVYFQCEYRTDIAYTILLKLLLFPVICIVNQCLGC